VRFAITHSKARVMFAAFMVFSTSIMQGESGPTRQIPSGEKAKVTGTIVSRHGDLVTVREKKAGDLILVNLFEDTKIERRKGQWEFFRHPRMDVTAMVPGLRIEAQGVGNPRGELNARTISFKPDVFAIEIAEEQQITANKEAAEAAQSTANSGLDTARTAESAANQAQSAADDAQHTANEASGDAQTAADLGALDAEALQIINKRVSELDNYETIAETAIYFGNDKPILDGAAKKQLDQLADIATSLDGYMIEIAGYASSPGSRKLNQKLSEERAAAVAQYLRETKDVPMRRILAPAGYGATHLFASTADPEDRPLDRRVDIKVLVNRALSRLP
jgi:outer membrane protein OmpA-like peptidoglycan-associated protein